LYLKDTKKKQNQQTKRSSTGQVDDFARKRPAEVLAAVTQENKRKKITSVRDKGQGTSNNPGGSSGDNDKRKRKKQHRKEVIDYSAIQADKEPETNADPKSKVRSWLLASSQCRPETSARTNVNGMPKSKSTPVGLTASGGAVGSRVPVSRQQALTSTRVRPGVEIGRAELKNSLNSLARKERARLQVVYKPPFRFSVKLRKSDKVAQAPATAVNHTNANRTKLPRTGVLLRTAKRKDRVRIGRARQIAPTGIGNSGGDLPEPANSDLHTVPSDLEVLLSESEFLFSDT